METQELHRGRLIDHIQLVVRDLAASHAFYTAIFEVLQVPLGGTGENYFWADELFASTSQSAAAQGHLTGRHHLAFQAQDEAMVQAFYKAALAHGGKDNGAPGERPTTRATTPPSCSTPMATTSRPCSTARPRAARHRSRSSSDGLLQPC
jgi:catechol 2,3-dioxygenase-like lactoylglutathione lyase family enzyme